MRFTKPFWEGIADGTITVAYRGWKSPTVVAGRPYRTGGGRIEVVTVEQIAPAAVTSSDAAKAGYSSVGELLENIRTDEDRELYRVEFRLLDEPDPREELANNSTLSNGDIAEIAAKLARLDASGKQGPWTMQVLQLIDEHPARRAPDLAEMVGRETKPFKLDVRKLKNLGLTMSLKIGYQLSPRGQAYLRAQHGVDV